MSFIDRFVPERYENDLIALNKSKQIILVGFVTSVMVVLQSTRYFTEGKVLSGMLVVLAGVFIALGPVILKLTSSRIVAGNYTVGVLFLLIVAIFCYRGGVTSPATAYFTIPTLLAFTFTDIKSGILWGIVSIITLCGVFFAEQSGIDFPSALSNPKELETYSLSTFSILLVLMIVVGLLFEVNNSRNLNELTERSDQIKKGSKDVRTMLEDVYKVMEAVSRNDLSQSVTVELEGDLGGLRESVNKALLLLSQTLRQVSDSSDQFYISANELSTSAQTMAEGATNQAASLEEISSSMEEMENQIKMNSDNSSQSKRLANETLNTADQGNQQMEEMLLSIQTINESSSNVSKVVKVIDEIAFQTNLLALNASVEAARAGKYGKGFTVVAEEVRNLAGRSKDAVEETNQLIENSIHEVKKGVQIAKQTAEILKKINDRVKKINDLIEEGNASSIEQKNWIQEINRSLSLVNNVVQQNSSIAEQTAASSEELSSQSAHLQELLNRFSLFSNETEGNSLVGLLSPDKHPSRPPFQPTRPAQNDLKRQTDKKRLIPDTQPKMAATKKVITLDDDSFGKY